MLGLAVGIDYALFILSRHRTQVRDGMAIEDSIALAVGTAGSAVVFAGSTVIIALVALVDDRRAVPGADGHRRRGRDRDRRARRASRSSRRCSPFAGARMLRGKTFAADGRQGRHDLGARWVGVVMRRPVIAAERRRARARRARHPGARRPPRAAQRRHRATRTRRSARPTTSSPRASASASTASSRSSRAGRRRRAPTAQALATLPDVAAVSPAQAIPGKDLALISVTPSSGPSSAATEHLVNDDPRPRDFGRAHVLVTGQTATNIDVSQKMAGSLIPYLAVVVGLALILLMVAFRSILVPLTAIGGFLLTIAASFGAVVLVFQKGVGAELIGVAQTGPLVSLLPVLIIGVIFGLAMDYQVFLVSRMHEEHAHGATARDAVRDGFRAQRPRGHGRGADHDQRVRGLHPPRRPDHQVDRLRLRRRHPDRRVPGPHDADPGADDPARRARLVAAALAGPRDPEPRHRGRRARAPPRPPAPDPGLAPSPS